MFTEIIEILVYIFLGVGVFFNLLAGVGLLRFPDVYTRLHAGTKATTLGSMLFLSGMGCLQPAWIPKLFLIVFFIILTNPVSGHALARAVHMRPEEKPDNLLQDDLAEPDQEGVEVK